VSPQVTHDVDHGFRLASRRSCHCASLQDVQQGSRELSSRSVWRPAAGVLLVVGQDVEHRPALVVALSQASLQRLHLAAESTRGWRGRAGSVTAVCVAISCITIRPPIPQAVDFFRRLSSAFSKAIILSSRRHHLLEFLQVQDLLLQSSWTSRGPDHLLVGRMSRRIDGAMTAVGSEAER